jgi:hypothetical protein
MLALNLPAWLYEFAVIPATLLGALVSAVLEKLFQPTNRDAVKLRGVSADGHAAGISRTRNRAHLTFAVIACAVGSFFAGYLLRDGLKASNIVEILRVVATFIGFVGGNFVLRQFENVRWSAFISVPALALYAVAIFDVWYEHHSRHETTAMATPSPTASAFSTPSLESASTPIGTPAPTQTNASADKGDASPPSDASNSPSAQPLSTAAPESPIHRVINGMNSPDAATRLQTLRQAVRSGDTYLRNLALSMAFAASDNNLRSVALRDSLQTSPSFVVTIEGALPTADPISQATGRSIEINIQDASGGLGRFKVLSSVSNTPGSVVVSGQTLTFNVALNKVLNADDFCSGTETMVPRRSVLKGRMHCQYNHGLLGTFTGNYDIVTEVH